MQMRIVAFRIERKGGLRLRDFSKEAEASA